MSSKGNDKLFNLLGQNTKTYANCNENAKKVLLAIHFPWSRKRHEQWREKPQDCLF
jgi:hypothetical protein